MTLEHVHPRVRTALKFLAHPMTIAAIGSFWLMIASLNNVPLTADEGRWGYQAHIWVHYGAAPYTGSVENKGPGIFLLFAISELLFGAQYWFPRVMGILCMVGTSFLLYQIGRKWRDHWTGLIAMTVFLLASAWWSFHGPLVSQTESFMTLFATLSFYWIVIAPPEELNRAKRLVIAGFFVGVAMAFKQIAITSAAALAFFVLDSRTNEDSPPQSPWRSIGFIGFGVILATALSLMPIFASKVSIRDYIEGAWLILLNRGSSHPRTLRTVFGSVMRMDMVLFLICFIYLWKNRKELEDKKIPIGGLLAWMIFDLLGVQAQGWYHGHNFKQLLPSLSLAIGLSMRRFLSGFPAWEESGLLATTWLLIALMVGSRQMPTISGAAEQWNHPALSNEQILGQWLKEHTADKDYVYTFGSVYVSGQTASDSAIRLQYYSGRRSSSRHFNDYFVDASAIPEVVYDLTVGHPPRYIILWGNTAPEWLRKVVGESYTYTFNRANFWVYERTGRKQ